MVLLVVAIAAIPMALGRIGGGLPGDGLVSDWVPGYVVPPATVTTAGESDDASRSSFGTVAELVGAGQGTVTQIEDSGTPEAEAAVAASEPTEEPQQAAYVEHTVEPGDTLYSIADRYGMSIDTLLMNNPLVGTDPDSLIIGQKMLVPGTEGLVYDVRLGDTINDIAARYGVDPSAVVAFSPNGLASPDMIREGMQVVLPGAVPPAPPPLPEVVETPVAETPEPAPVTAPPVVAVAAIPEPEVYVPTPAGIVTAPPAAPVVEAAPSYGLIWPVAGPINSYFGPRWGSWHSGIDIGAGTGTAVGAAGSGQVILSTYSGNGYGNYVIIRHTDGSETLYAHLSSNYVGLGQYVGQGEIIGTVGCTGWCTGPHLHFEVHIGGTAVNPLGYLP